MRATKENEYILGPRKKYNQELKELVQNIPEDIELYFDDIVSSYGGERYIKYIGITNKYIILETELKIKEYSTIGANKTTTPKLRQIIEETQKVLEENQLL